MKHILVVEDDKLLCFGLRFDLEADGYTVDTVNTVQGAVESLIEGTYDLIILDVSLPDGNGFELCSKLKAIKDISIIFLTACDLEADQIMGFELGADDYITKPFSMALFRKRVAAVLKRSAEKNEKNTYSDGFLLINFDTLEVLIENEIVVLTPMEYKLLKLFISNSGRVLTRKNLLTRLWDNEGNFVDEHALTVNINRLRSKIESADYKYIKTIYGMGYQWSGGKREK